MPSDIWDIIMKLKDKKLYRYIVHKPTTLGYKDIKVDCKPLKVYYIHIHPLNV